MGSRELPANLFRAHPPSSFQRFSVQNFSFYFNSSPGFWLRLQLDYELMRAARENGERIHREVQPHAA